MRESNDAHGPLGAEVERGERQRRRDGALGEEIYPAAGLVARDHLDKRFAELEARFTWKIIGLLGVQIVIFFLIATYL
jgi:hypothetical protein